MKKKRLKNNTILNTISYLFLLLALYLTWVKRKEVFSFVGFLRHATKQQKIELFNTLISKELAVFLVTAVIMATASNIYLEMPKYVPFMAGYVRNQALSVVVYCLLSLVWIIVNRISYESKFYEYGDK